MARETSGKPQAAKTTRLIYCGPSLPGGVFPRHMIIKGEGGSVPPHLQELFDKCPSITALLVPVSSFAATEKAIMSKGTQEHYFFTEVQKYIKGGK